MGRKSRAKQFKLSVAKKLQSQDFKDFVKKCTHGMPDRAFNGILNALLERLHEGYVERWFSITAGGVAHRVGFESDGTCYVVLEPLDVNQPIVCYNYQGEVTLIPRDTPPQKVTNHLISI